MSEKNFVAYGDAESILTGYANRIKQSPITFVGTQAQWNALSSSQKAEYELVDITDDSLSPSGHVDWESNGELGAKNLLPFDISHIIRINGGGTWNGLAYTYNGVTYTLLSDGTVRVNGTATAYSLFRIIDANSIFLNPSNDYYITGSPSSSTASTYYVYYSELINGSWVYYSNLGDEDTLFTPNITATQCVVDIVVRDGQIADNVIFKPMLRLATDPDTTYQPYSMTNKEMAPYVQAISNPNLLDNPWFTVNQRGNTFYQTENGYCVDRWILGKGAFTARETNAPYGVLQTRVANTNGWLRQKTEFELDTTKPITYSAIISASVTSDYGFALKFSNMDDYNDSKIKWFPTTANQKVLVHFTDLPFKNTAFEVVANAGASSTVKIYALKVELGTVSTLAMDTEPNYQQELAKCQRYFVRIKGYPSPSNTNTLLGIGIGFTDSTNVTAIKSTVVVPTTMRQLSPLMTISSASDFVYETGNAITIRSNKRFSFDRLRQCDVILH